MASTRPRMVYSSATGMFDFPRMGDVRIVKFDPFRAHLMMSQKADAVTANPVKHKPAADKAVVIGQDAAPEQETTPARTAPGMPDNHAPRNGRRE